MDHVDLNGEVVYNQSLLVVHVLAETWTKTWT